MFYGKQFYINSSRAFVGLEQEGGGAVAPAALELVEQATVVEAREALGGECGAGDAAAETLEALAVVGRHGDGGVEREPGDVRAERQVGRD